MKTYPQILSLRAALAGGCVGPGSVKPSKIAHRAPFRSLVHQRVVLQRPMLVRASPSRMGQPYSDTCGKIRSVPASELADDCDFGIRSSDLALVAELMSFTTPANLAGLPAISFPAGYTTSGPPVGIQAIGQPWEESLLLRIAFAGEACVERQAPATLYPILNSY